MPAEEKTDITLLREIRASLLRTEAVMASIADRLGACRHAVVKDGACCTCKMPVSQ